MERLEEFIEKKKLSSAKTPRYGMKKLAVGLVSCILGYTILVSPSVSAESVNSAYVLEDAVVDDAVVLTESTETIVLDDAVVSGDMIYSKPQEAVVMEEKPTEAIVLEDDEAEDNEKNAIIESSVKESAELDSSKLIVNEELGSLDGSYSGEEKNLGFGEDQEEKESYVLTEEQRKRLEERYTESEIIDIEKDIVELRKNGNFDVDVYIDEKMRIKSNGEVVRNAEILIGGATKGAKAQIINPTGTEDRIDANTDLNLKVSIDIDINEDIKCNDYFDINISNNVNFHGIVKEEEVPYLEYNGEVIAEGRKLVATEGRGYRYTFNKVVNDLTDIRVKVEYPLFIEPETVKFDSEKEMVAVKVGRNQKAKSYKVKYESGVYDINLTTNRPTLSGSANIDKVTANTYRQIVYVNPTEDQGINNSHIVIKNKVASTIRTRSVDPEEKSNENAIFDEEVKNSIKVYRVKDANDLPLSYAIDFNDGNYEDVTSQASISIQKDSFDANSLNLDLNQSNFDSSAYVILYSGKRVAETETRTLVEFTADERKYKEKVDENINKFNYGWKWTNEIVFDASDASADAEQKGYFQEHHIYITKDQYGKETGRKTEKSKVFVGTKDKEYTTGKIEKDGFKFVKTENPVNEPSYNEKGERTTGNFKPGVTQEITYVYEKVVEKKGSFKEIHVYKTLDFEGNVIEDKTITKAGKSSEGTKDEKYDSSKIDKDGYVFTKVTADQGSEEVTISEDGKTVESGNYVEDKELAVTYEYVKQPGRFIEHHIYQTVDKNGKVLSTDERVDIPEKDGKPIEGYKDDTFKTSAKEKDDYKLVQSPKITSNNFVPGETIEVTYIYQKAEKKGSFQDHHIYITKDQDGKEIKREVVDGDVTGGTKDMTYTTGKAEKDGFKFVRTETPVEDPTYNQDGSVATGNFKPGVKQEITYVYEKTEIKVTPIEETGTFQEHHIYRTIDKDGKVTEEKVDGKVIGGTSAMTYTTGKIDKKGFTFIGTVDAKEDPTFDKNGKSTTGNFKPGVKQEITYVYEKKEKAWTSIEETGKFQEHHIYITKDKDGKEIKREVVNGDVTGGTKDMTYTTGKAEKDGFKFVRTENPVNEPTFDEKGAETEGNYKPGVKQEITYVYERTEQPWVPIEPSEPEEPIQPVTPNEPIKPEEPEKPYEPERPEYPEEPERPHRPHRPRTPEREEEKPEPKEEPKLIEYKEFPKYYAPPVETTEVAETPVAQETPIEETPVVETPVVETPEDYSKAPQTSVPGAAGYLGLAGLASAALAYIEDKKRKNK